MNAQLAQAQQEATLEFPVDGRLAVAEEDSPKEDNSGHNLTLLKKPVMIDVVWKILYCALAMVLSSSGILLFVAIFSQQVGGARAMSVPQPSVQELKVPEYIHVKGSQESLSSTAYVAAYNVSAGVAWDTCAGICMFNVKTPFYKWDSNPIPSACTVKV